jgi:hypothetical protein
VIAKYTALILGVTLTVPVSAPILPGERELVEACKRGIAVCYEVRLNGTVHRIGGPGAALPERRAGSPQRPSDSPPGLAQSP